MCVCWGSGVILSYCWNELFTFLNSLSLTMLFCLSKSIVSLFMAIRNWFFSFSFLSAQHPDDFPASSGDKLVLVFSSTEDGALFDHRLSSLGTPWVLFLYSPPPSLFPSSLLQPENLNSQNEGSTKPLRVEGAVSWEELLCSLLSSLDSQFIVQPWPWSFPLAHLLFGVFTVMFHKFYPMF